MDHYTIASSVTTEDQDKKEPCDVYVKSGSKICTIISQVRGILQTKECEKITLIGSGPSVTKAITCAEIIKRKARELHQLNKLFYTKTEDTWEGKQESLDKLQVTRRIPSISITLSKAPLDVTQPGYQAPGKSKSPVQFGDEDWELSWDDDLPKEPKRTTNEHISKAAKSTSERNKDEDIHAKSAKMQDKFACSISEDPEENGASMGIPLPSLNGADMKSKQDQSERNNTRNYSGTPRKPKPYREHKSRPFANKKQKPDYP